MKIWSGSSKLLLAVACFSCGAVNAQCGGINTGGGNCTPPTAPGMPASYDNNGNNGGQLTPRYISQWGAISIDSVKAASGAVTGRMSRRQAEDDAQDQCVENGGKACQLVISYDNSCAAVAWAPGGAMTASDSDLDAAKDRAMHNCAKRKTGCQIVYSACSLPREAN